MNNSLLRSVYVKGILPLVQPPLVITVSVFGFLIEALIQAPFLFLFLLGNRKRKNA